MDNYMAPSYANQLKQSIRRRAEVLRRIADDIESQADYINPTAVWPDTKDFMSLVAAVQHTVLHGITKMDLAGLISDAFHAAVATAPKNKQ